ncbi:MAG: response regulator [Pseudomonadota bacterium]
MATEKRATVLIIDDNELTRTVLRMILQGNGFDVAGEASTADAGLRQAKRLQPDIICLDIQMPDRDGLDLLQILVELLPDTTVLMVTAHNDAATVRKAVERGAKGFIIKPFNSGTVLDTVKAVLAQRQSMPAAPRFAPRVGPA